MLKTICFTLAACFAGSAAAQTTARPDPADPEVARWRQSNEEIGHLGGHVGDAPRESGATVKPGAMPPVPSGIGEHK